MRKTSRLGGLAATAIAAIAVAVPAAIGSAHGQARAQAGATTEHVLLISVDGLHQSDLSWFDSQHPNSTLAQLAGHGAQYTNAHTPVPSDSFPGLLAQVTGGNPGTTGVYYDNEYDHNLLPAGTTNCTHPGPKGTAVIYDSPQDLDPTRLDAGQGLSGLPGSILQMTPTPRRLVNPALLPVDPHTCQPVYPHQYLKVNTIFDVIHSHGLRTAWSDKHPAYDILDGPSGNGIDDLFTPEIDSNAIGYPAGTIWTSDNAATMQYDNYKVQAVLNEIDGFDHSRTTHFGTPAIFGMNFQTVSTAEKLPSSDGLTGGYLPGSTTPGPLLRRALGFINNRLSAMAAELRARGVLSSTAIILSAKHGQSPQDPNLLTRIDDGPIIDGVNAAWMKLHPGRTPLVAQATDDDGMEWWLSDRSQGAATFAKQYLLSHSATGNTANGGTRRLPASGLAHVFAGAAAARYFHVPVNDPRVADLTAVAQTGVVYTGGRKKIAEHGGAHPDDLAVPLVVYAPGRVSAGIHAASLETTRIAPTILRLLGLDPNALQAVRIEGTQVLPGIQ